MLANPKVVSATPSLIGAIVVCVLLPSLILVMLPHLAQAMLYGALAWAAAVIVKVAVSLVPGAKHIIAAGKIGAAIWGAFSGLAELGFLSYLMIEGLVSKDAAGGAAAGIGAASLEIVYLLANGVVEDIRRPDPARYQAWLRGARRSLWVANMIFIERSAATMLHVGTRGLLALSLSQKLLLPIMIAIITFAAVDGLATYGAVRKWNWFNPILCRRFFQFILLAGAFNLALFALYAM